MNARLALFDAFLLAGEVAEARAWLETARAAQPDDAELNRAFMALAARLDDPTAWAAALAACSRLPARTGDDVLIEARLTRQLHGMTAALAVLGRWLYPADGASADPAGQASAAAPIVHADTRPAQVFIAWALEPDAADSAPTDALYSRVEAVIRAYAAAAHTAGRPGRFWRIRAAELAERRGDRAAALAAFRAELSTFRAEPDTFRAEPDTFRAEPDTFRAEPDTFRAEPDTFRAEPDAPGAGGAENALHEGEAAWLRARCAALEHAEDG
jgi:hypothetical protein